MNVFARYGYDVWTMDLDGYGYSGSSGNNSDITSSVEDLKAAIPAVSRGNRQAKKHFFGTPPCSIPPPPFSQTPPGRGQRAGAVALHPQRTRAPREAQLGKRR